MSGSKYISLSTLLLGFYLRISTIPLGICMSLKCLTIDLFLGRLFGIVWIVHWHVDLDSGPIIAQYVHEFVLVVWLDLDSTLSDDRATQVHAFAQPDYRALLRQLQGLVQRRHVSETLHVHHDLLVKLSLAEGTPALSVPLRTHRI